MITILFRISSEPSKKYILFGEITFALAFDKIHGNVHKAFDAGFRFIAAFDTSSGIPSPFITGVRETPIKFFE